MSLSSGARGLEAPAPFLGNYLANPHGHHLRLTKTRGFRADPEPSAKARGISHMPVTDEA
jgi:hypothetical protein